MPGRSSVGIEDTIASERDTVLLFFKQYEQDTYVRHDRYLKRVLRPVYNRMHSRQKKTGFAVSFELLQRALRLAGYNVRVNDYAFARRRPTHPVGLVGFPHLLEDWDLPNPALLGPSLYDHPGLAPDLMNDPRFRNYLVLADWVRDMFSPVYGDACVSWFAGIDTDAWPDYRSSEKDIDVLIYDKLYWNRHVMGPRFLLPIQRRLEARGLNIETVRYKFYDQKSYRDLLRRSKAMVFLCEHETQGIAYQEALACNVPVLAWDFGVWADPQWKLFSRTLVPASSVPFFSEECGERFQMLDDFDAALDRFLEKKDRYEPRRYVETRLSMQRSAEIYAGHYFALS